MLLKVNSDGFLRASDCFLLLKYHPAKPNKNISGNTTDGTTIVTKLEPEPPLDVLPVVNSEQIPVAVSTCIVLVSFMPIGNPQAVLDIDTMCNFFYILIYFQ